MFLFSPEIVASLLLLSQGRMAKQSLTPVSHGTERMRFMTNCFTRAPLSRPVSFPLYDSEENDIKT